MLLLDTSQHPVEDRDEILRAGISELAGLDLAPVDGDELMNLRFRAWDMGDGCSLLHSQSTGLNLTRPPSRGCNDGPPVLGFAMMPAGGARFSQHDRQDIVPPGGMSIVEMNDPFTFNFASRSSEGINFQVPLEVLDVPLGEVRIAAEFLPLSPVYPLARQHLMALLRYTAKFGAPQPCAQQAALHVIRALVKSFRTD